MRKDTNHSTSSDTMNQQTSPRGMAPDKAHATRDTTSARRNSETEENFNNSPQNAESRQSSHVKR